MNADSKVLPMTAAAPESQPHVAGNGGRGGGGDRGERIARLEATMEHLATREDLAKLEKRIADEFTKLFRWLCGFLIIGMLALVVAVLRTVLPIVGGPP